MQVQDENHKPVAGVAVTFFLADHGASGVFANGSQSMTVLTDTNGQAAMRGMVPNKMAGKMEIRVSARLGNLNADAVITQTNAAGAAGGRRRGHLRQGHRSDRSRRRRGGGRRRRGHPRRRIFSSRNSRGPTTPAAVTITAGTPTVGHP